MGICSMSPSKELYERCVQESLVYLGYNDYSNGYYWLFLLIRQLNSEWEATRIEALHWISSLLNRHRFEVTACL